MFFLKLVARSKKLFNYPLMSVYFIISFWPVFFYSHVAKKLSTNKILFILSFDCDIEEDINLLPRILNHLDGLGIKPSLMIPTEILLKRKAYIHELLSLGYEFVNHGHRIHTAREGTVYSSVFDYEKLSLSEIREDIIEANQIFKESFGYDFLGFRTPHFGNVQKKTKLKKIYEILRELGYKFSTSTIPYFLYQRGVFKTNGIFEIPLSGTFTVPLKILDSYNFYDQSIGSFDGTKYKDEVTNLINMYKKRGNGLINLYVDPSHINDNSDFFESMKLLSSSFTSTNYKSLVRILAND